MKMRKVLGFGLLLAVLVPLSLLAQQQSQALTNEDVLNMVKAGLAPEIVVAKIKSSRCDFDTSPNTLAELNKAGVPESVILAMVEAPRNAERVYAKCNYAPFELLSSANYAAAVVARLGCNEALTLLDKRDSLYWKVRTEQGKIGYVNKTFVSGEKQSEQANQTAVQTPTQQTPAGSRTSVLPPNVLRAVAWRGVPWATTSYYHQPGRAYTDCTGQGQWLGNFYQSNLSCTSSYTPAHTIPINWYHYTIYNLVETSDSYFVVACTRNWRFSKCSYLIPGNVFSFEYKKGQIWISGQRGGKSKEETLKYDIAATQSKVGQ